MSRKDQIQIVLTGTKLRESSKAVLFKITAISNLPIEPPKTEWFPLSQVSRMTYDPAAEPDSKDTLVVSEWIMKEKSLSNTPRAGKYSAPSDSDDYDYGDDAPWEN